MTDEQQMRPRRPGWRSGRSGFSREMGNVLYGLEKLMSKARPITHRSPESNS